MDTVCSRRARRTSGKLARKPDAYRSIWASAAAPMETMSSPSSLQTATTGTFSSSQLAPTRSAALSREAGDGRTVWPQVRCVSHDDSREESDEADYRDDSDLHRSDHFGIKNRNGEGPQDYRNAISRVVRARQAKDKNLFLIDGMTFFNDPLYLLPTDMVHPNNAGEQKMADGVVAVLKPIVARISGSRAP